MGSTSAGYEACGILVRFLGSGASGWKSEWAKKNPHIRRQSSILVENKIVFDFTMCGFDHLPKNLVPAALFVTHSHGDHFNAPAVVRVGVRKVYTHSSWTSHAKTVLEAAAQEAKAPPPGQKAYITHLGLKYHDWPSEKIEADISPELAAAYDGLEVRLG